MQLLVIIPGMLPPIAPLGTAVPAAFAPCGISTLAALVEIAKPEVFVGVLANIGCICAPLPPQVGVFGADEDGEVDCDELPAD